MTSTNKTPAAISQRIKPPPAFHIMTKPRGAICNLNCKYCYFLKKEQLFPESSFRMSDEILEKRKIIKEEDRHPPEALLFSMKRILKFDPVAPFRLIEQGFKRGTIKEIGGLELDSLNIKILKMILNGKAIRTNENLLARKLNVNRTTILRHIDVLLQNNVISKPVSRFPLIFVPPDYMLIFSLFEIKRRCNEVEGFIRRDPRVPLMIKANIGRYNYFVVSTFKAVEDFIDWQERYTQNFEACIEAIKNTYLSPAKTFSIKQSFLPLEFLKNKLDLLQRETITESQNNN